MRSGLNIRASLELSEKLEGLYSRELGHFSFPRGHFVQAGPLLFYRYLSFQQLRNVCRFQLNSVLFLEWLLFSFVSMEYSPYFKWRCHIPITANFLAQQKYRAWRKIHISQWFRLQHFRNGRATKVLFTLFTQESPLFRPQSLRPVGFFNGFFFFTVFLFLEISAYFNDNNIQKIFLLTFREVRSYNINITLLLSDSQKIKNKRFLQLTFGMSRKTSAIFETPNFLLVCGLRQRAEKECNRA